MDVNIVDEAFPVGDCVNEDIATLWVLVLCLTEDEFCGKANEVLTGGCERLLMQREVYILQKAMICFLCVLCGLC